MATEHLDQSSIHSTPEMMTFRNCNRWFHSKRQHNPCFKVFFFNSELSKLETGILIVAYMLVVR